MKAISVVAKHLVVIMVASASVQAAAFGQAVSVSGTAMDSTTGSTLPGVNVVVEGTTIGTTTGADGDYVIEAPSAQDTLVFSFVGYRSKQVPLRGRSTVDVQLRPSVMEADEVVVVGYGTQRRRDITGAISSVSEEDFNAGVTTSPQQLIQGKVAGVDIVESSGRPGADATVRIRGSGSISASNDPLYVIDGVPVQAEGSNNYVNTGSGGSSTRFRAISTNPLNTINPADIESIEVLKDASATAIYGSRGANGVIIVTTKNYSESMVSYNSYVSAASIRKSLPFLSRDQFVGYAEANGMEYPNEGSNTNWQDEIFRTGITQNHSLSFGNASGETSYRASLGYTDQEGVIRSSGLERYTGRINATHSAMENRLGMDLNLNVSRVEQTSAPVSSFINGAGGNMLKDALRWAPTLPVYNRDGSYYQIGELRVNPVSWQQLDDIAERNNVIGNVDLTYEILDPLEASINLGYTNTNLTRRNYIPAANPSGASENGRAALRKLQDQSLLLEADLTYAEDLTENSRLQVLGGYSFQRFVIESSFASANQFPSDETRWNLLQSGNALANESNELANRLISVYGRANYSLLDRYLLTLTLRNDGSSRFGENNRWGQFPSGSLAWIASEEPFFFLDPISNLKLRLGYGITGNQEIPNDLYREQLSIAGSATYQLGNQSVPSVLPSNYANPDLKWERTTQTNIGLDFGLLEGRLSGSVDYYIKNTSDLLLQFATAAPSVVETQWANVGAVENRGIEVALEGLVLARGDLRWNASANFAANRNEVISLSNDQYTRTEFRVGPSSGIVNPAAQPTQIIRPGLPLRTFWGREFTGLDEDGLETYLDEDGESGPDLVPIGNPYPDFNFGISSSVRWKNFDSSIALRGAVGNEIYNNTAAEFSYPSIFPGNNVLESVLYSEMSSSQTAQFSSRWIEDGSFIRLANLTVGYTVDRGRLPYLSQARVYVTGQNLFVLTGYSGFDPEVRTNTAGTGQTPIGIDYLAYPRPRSFQLGVSLSF